MLKLALIFSLFLTFQLEAEPNLNQVIAGAGPSTKVVQLFVKEFAKYGATMGYKFTVPSKSAKHAGGIKASNRFIFGRTGRPLNAKELKLDIDEIFLARVPVVFSVGAGVNITSLSMENLKKIYTGKITNWSKLGGPDHQIELLGREPTEALFSILKQEHSFFKEASQYFKKKFTKDHFVVTYLKKEAGKFALGFGAKPNFKGMKTLKIDGFNTGVNIGLVYRMRNEQHPLVKEAKQIVKSQSWLEAIKTLDLLPPSK